MRAIFDPNGPMLNCVPRKVHSSQLEYSTKFTFCAQILRMKNAVEEGGCVEEGGSCAEEGGRVR